MKYKIKFDAGGQATICLTATLPMPSEPLSIVESPAERLQRHPLEQIELLLAQFLSELVFGRNVRGK